MAMHRGFGRRLLYVGSGFYHLVRFGLFNLFLGGLKKLFEDAKAAGTKKK